MSILVALIFLGSLLHGHAQEIFGYCTTPTEQSGTCIYLARCNYLYDLLQKPSLSASERSLLQNSQCGYQNGQVLICCANSRRLSQPPVWGQVQPLSQSMPRPTAPSTSQPPNPPSRSSLLPRAPNCGENFGNRIVGGNVTDQTEFPWLALIEYTKSTGEIGHLCGGSLISNRYVITAGHCVAGLPPVWRVTGVRLGDWDTSTNPDCTTSWNGRQQCNDPFVDVAVAEITPHPQYVPGSRDQLNDIALLRLVRQVPFTNFISPVCLPTLPEQRSNIFPDRPMIVAGWGRTETDATSNIKLKAEIKSLSWDNCNRRYSSQQRTITSKQLCAGGVEGIDSCRGDSGGPLVLEEYSDNNANYYLTGIVSYGPTPCGLAGWPGVYTLVSEYIDWIESTIKA